MSSNGELSLDTTHSYYYQIQLQMFLSSTTYGDFIVWAPAAFHVERIAVDNDFVRTAIERVNHFYLVGLMPELLGKWCTQQRPTLRQGDDTGDQDDEQYCFCKRDDVEGDMIECGNGTCIIQWFHLRCLRMSKVPKGKWYCPECRQSRSSKKKTLSK